VRLREVSHARPTIRRRAAIIHAMSETDYLSIFDESVPRRKWSFQQKALAAAVLLFAVVPLVLSALLILVMIIFDPPK
jgi:hypothetical protein